MSVRFILGSFFGLILLGMVGQMEAASMPETIQIQGVLRAGDESPLVGTRQWEIQFYNAATGGNTLGGAMTGQTVVSETGRWSISLMPPAEVLNASGTIWYSLGIDSATVPDGTLGASDFFTTRVPVHSVLFAQRAREAQAIAGIDTDDLATESEIHALVADRVTTVALDTALAAKADLGHNHDGVYALVSHSHDFSELTGTATDAQIPDDITINLATAALTADTATTASYATMAGTADFASTATKALMANMATTASIALSVAGFDADGFATDAELTTGLAGKADASHAHAFGDLTGSATDAQIPDDITIDFATAALSADTATTASIALALDGFNAGDFATDAELSTGLAGKADASHAHAFGDLTGSATDAQIPDDITIDFATAAGSATTAGSAATATSATTAETATTATVALALDSFNPADYATDAELTSGLAGKSDTGHVHDDRYYTESEVDTALAGKAAAAHGHNLQDLSGAVTDAQVPDNITITEADTLDTVTDRGASTTNDITVGDVNADDVTLTANTAPGLTANTLYNVSGNLFWDGTQLNADADTLAGISGSNGDVLTYNSGSWAAAAPSGGGGGSAASYCFVRQAGDDSSVTAAERTYGASAAITEVKAGSDLAWDDANNEIDVSTTGVYEIIFNAHTYGNGTTTDGYTEYDIDIQIGGVTEANTRKIVHAYGSNNVNRYSQTLHWVGSITSGQSIKGTVQNTTEGSGGGTYTPDPIGFQRGASFMVRKLD